MLRPSAYGHVGQVILAGFCLVGTVALIHAQDKQTPIEKCGDLHTQAEMNDCAYAEAKKAETALNAAYQGLLSAVKKNKTATEKVIAAEEAWMVFRDAELAAEWPVPEGENPNLLYGSVHPLCYYDELARMTWDRVNTLKHLMRSEEGDVCSSGLAQLRQGGGTGTCTPVSAKTKKHQSSNPRSSAVPVGE